MSYKFKYKRKNGLLWRTLEKVVGHFYDNQIVELSDANGHKTLRQAQDRMIVYFEDGSLYAIRAWSECELKLGTDWVLFNKREMEKKTGQSVQLNVTPGS